MILASILLLLAAQAAEPLRQPDGPPEPWPDRLRFDEEGTAVTEPADLATVQQFGACIADASPDKAIRTLAGDFRSQAYRRGLDQLVDMNRNCPTARGWRRMRASRLLLAGAIAERLVERGAAPVNSQLAKAAMKPAAPSWSPTDGGAMCVVRSAPDEVGRLFATEAGSAPERAAAAPLKALFSRCMGGRPVEASDAGLRAMLATAAFRSVQSGAGN